MQPLPSPRYFGMICLGFFLFFFFGLAHSTSMFTGQGTNLSPSSVNALSLTARPPRCIFEETPSFAVGSPTACDTDRVLWGGEAPLETKGPIGRPGQFESQFGAGRHAGWRLGPPEAGCPVVTLSITASLTPQGILARIFPSMLLHFQ